MIGGGGGDQQPLSGDRIVSPKGRQKKGVIFVPGTKPKV
jgi:hypothetical protein